MFTPCKFCGLPQRMTAPIHGRYVCGNRSCEFFKRDSSDIDVRFLPFLNSGERVEVTWKKGMEDYSGYGARTDGRKARFYVGRSTGWSPILLMIYRRGSIGGGGILSSAVESIRGLGTFR